MSTIDEQVEELFKQCPILREDTFTKKFPGVQEVIIALDSAYRLTKGLGEPLMAYKIVGAKNTQEFVNLLNSEDKKAIREYRELKDKLI